MKILKLIIFGIVTFSSVFAQKVDSLYAIEDVSVLAKNYSDSVVLRWAPGNFEIWSEANRNGYIIERYTMVRNNTAIPPESKMLTIQPLILKPLEDWKDLVQEDNYAAIAAQALFGEEFSINMDNSDAISIVNKVQENEQRFFISLLCADLSPRVAKKSGLWFSDTTVQVGEKYLYRIMSNTPSKIYRGSVFINTNDSVLRIPPRHLEAKVSGRLVELKWKVEEKMRFVGFHVERSLDSVRFEMLGNLTNVTLSTSSNSATNFNYASDTIPSDGQQYYYRVRGVDSFGEISPPSNTVVVRSVSELVIAPRIFEAISRDNQAVAISWEFPVNTNGEIRGFVIERGINDKSLKPLHNSFLDPTARHFIDRNPLVINYYKVVAIAKSGKKLPSFPQLVTLVDSIPPTSPIGLKAVVDKHGRVELTWTPNSEPDLYGYRVYKSNHVDEEEFQLTSAPILQPAASDLIDLNTLNNQIFYAVVAIDRNQNQSRLSAKLRVDLPDIVPPVAPIALPCQMDSSGVVVRWIRSSSIDVQFYEVYRAELNTEHNIRLKVVLSSSDTLMYKDMYGRPGQKYEYSIVAVDSSGNLSTQSSPVLGLKMKSNSSISISWKNSIVNIQDRTVLINWDCKDPDVDGFKIYKSIHTKSGFSLYKTVKGSTRQLLDHLMKNEVQYYKVMAFKINGERSPLSSELKVQF